MKRLSCYKRLTLVFIGVFSILISGCSSLKMNESASFYADNPELDRVQNHAYAGAGVGASWLNPDTSEVDGVDVDDRVNSGGQITVGMDMSRQLALELHSADLGSAGISPSGRINYHLHGASALIYAGKQRHKFKRNGLTGFGRIGFGMLENSAVGDLNYQKENSTHVLFGAGLEYMTRMGLGARAEVIYYEEDARYGQLALVYRTGRRPEPRRAELAEEPVPQPTVAAALPVIKEEPPSICESFEGSLAQVRYRTDSDELTDDGAQALQQAASHLNECPEAGISISGHTDNVGSDSYNNDLSIRRAQGVESALIQMGIQLERIQTNGFGEAMPVDSNDTREGRRLNRRVELEIQ